MKKTERFTGFPPGALTFLADLAAHNNREWFEAHKDDYLTLIREPSVAFITALGDRLKTIAPGIVYDTRSNGAGSLMRIYRDVRFNPDKTPYKTSVGIIFWESSGKRTETPAFYFHLDPSGAVMYAGMRYFAPPMLDLYRRAVMDETLGAELEQTAARAKSLGYRFGGEAYQRVPAPFSPGHPRAHWLRYNGLGVSSPAIPPAVVTSPQVVEVCFEHCRHMAGVQQWLVKVQARLQPAAAPTPVLIGAHA